MLAADLTEVWRDGDGDEDYQPHVVLTDQSFPPAARDAVSDREAVELGLPFVAWREATDDEIEAWETRKEEPLTLGELRSLTVIVRAELRDMGRKQMKARQSGKEEAEQMSLKRARRLAETLAKLSLLLSEAEVPS